MEWFGPELRRGFTNAKRDVVEFPEQFKESNGVCKSSVARLESKGPQIAVIGTLTP